MNRLSTNEIIHIISFLDNLSITTINRYYYDVTCIFFNPLSIYGKNNRITLIRHLHAKKMAKWLSGHNNKTYTRCFISSSPSIIGKMLLAYSIRDEHLNGFYYLLRRPNIVDIELNNFMINGESFRNILNECLQLKNQVSFSVSYNLMTNDQCKDLCQMLENPLFQFQRLQISNISNFSDYQKNYISKTLQKLSSVKRFCIRYCNVLTWVADAIQQRSQPFDSIEIKSVQNPFGISQICDAIAAVGHPISLDLSFSRISIKDFINILGLLPLNLLVSINVSNCLLNDNYATILYYAVRYMIPYRSRLHTIFAESNLFSLEMKRKLSAFNVIFI